MLKFTLEDMLVTDEQAQKLLSHPTEKYILLKNYGHDKKLVVYQPYIPVLITPPNVKNNKR